MIENECGLHSPQNKQAELATGRSHLVVETMIVWEDVFYNGDRGID